MLDLSLFRIATFRDPAVAGSLFRTGAGAVPFLIPVMLQIGFGMSASQSGFVSFATALGAFAMKPLVRPLLRRTGFRGALVINGVVASLGIGALALVTPAWPAAAIFALLAAGGLARSLQFTALNTLAFADVLPDQRGSAATLSSMFQQISMGLGTACAAFCSTRPRPFAATSRRAWSTSTPPSSPWRRSHRSAPCSPCAWPRRPAPRCW